MGHVVQSMLFSVGETIGGFFAVITFSALAMGGLDALSAFYSAYQRAVMRLDDERWLLSNCRDPVFFSKMRAHTNVCIDVEAHARVGPWLFALMELSDAVHANLQPWMSCSVYTCIVVLAVFLCLCVACVPIRSKYLLTRNKRGFDFSYMDQSIALTRPRHLMQSKDGDDHRLKNV